MNSALLSCRVVHERYAPTGHAFEYPVHACLLHLDELDALDRDMRLFSHNRFNLASLLDKDYLTDDEGTIREKLVRMLAKENVDVTDGDAVYLVTSPRLANYVFNPVCFYWIFRDDRLRACVAEVNNTFGEKHVYPLPGPGETEGFPALYHADKTFHVSPFFDRQGEYEFHFSDIRETLDVSVTLTRPAGQEPATAFHASIAETGPRRPLTDGALLRTVLRRPFTSHLTFPRILWEAGKIHFGKKIGYNPKPAPASPMTIRHDASPSLTQKLARSLIHRHLRSYRNGRLTLTLPDGSSVEYGGGDGPAASVQVNSLDFFPRILLHGDIGLGEAYTAGQWDSPELADVYLFFLANRKQLVGSLRYDLTTRLTGYLQHAIHQLAPKNDEAGSRKNIAAHYDLSNELFAKFLDPTMTYSSGVFTDQCDGREDHAEAQRRKNRLLADKARITADDHVLEIGCGWGGFAEQIARERGCRITGVTVSEQQYEYAVERIKKAGLDDRVNIRLQDYRRIEEQFDKVVSVEMLEAVGHEFHREYFKTLDRLLKPGGLASIQTITIQDPHYDHYRWTMDWVRKHVFPGGLLPSLTRICRVTARHTRLVVQNVDAIGPHYANTLRRWRDAFNDRWDEIEPLGFDDFFRRTWNHYLAVCEAGFAHGHINNLQLLLSRAEPDAVQRCCYASLTDDTKSVD